MMGRFMNFVTLSLRHWHMDEEQFAQIRARLRERLEGGNPYYNRDERRVAKYLQDLTKGTIGAGPDPVGFLIASHQSLSMQNMVREARHEPASEIPALLRLRRAFRRHRILAAASNQ